MQEIYFSKIWNYPLFNIGNNDMMVSNLVIALFMLWIGMKYCKILVAKLHTYIAKNIEEDNTTAYVLQKIVTYMIIFIYGIFILDLANIPISSFAFLGGTIALSVGLGAQALIGNFLSGLIVVLEKSLKIGDIVEINGVVGVVQSIGIRSTIIRTFSDSHIVIPNSNFIHSIFVKLKTHKNLVENNVRVSIEIGDQNESKVRDLILAAVNSIDSVADSPKANIHLIGISGTKYLYSVYFYSKIAEQYNIEYIRDLINIAVKDKFKESKFDIAYPYEFKTAKEK